MRLRDERRGILLGSVTSLRFLLYIFPSVPFSASHENTIRWYPMGDGGEREKSSGWTRKFGEGGEIVSGTSFRLFTWTRDSSIPRRMKRFSRSKHES